MKFILFAILLPGPVAHAGMGEIERVAGWSFNAVSFGTVLAQVNADRAKIMADFEIRKAQIRRDIETQAAAAQKNRLQQAIAYDQQALTSLDASIGKCEESQKSLSAIGSILQNLYISHDTAAKNLAVLTETIRQEINLSETGTADLQSLVDQCRAWEKDKQTSLPACQAAEMVAQASETPSVANPYAEALRQIDTMTFKATVAQGKLNLTRGELQADADATRAQLEKMP